MRKKREVKRKENRITYFDVKNRKHIIYARVECFIKNERSIKHMVVTEFNLNKLNYDRINIYSLKEWVKL